MTTSPQRVPSHSHSALPSPPISPVSPSPTTTSVSDRAGGTTTTTRIKLKPTRTQSAMETRAGTLNWTRPVQERPRRRASSSMSRVEIRRGEVITLPTASSPSPSPSSSPSSSPSFSTPAPGSGTITQASVDVKAKRRQSSMAYFTPSSPSPWETRPISMSESADMPPRGHAGKRESGTWGGGAGGSKRASGVVGMGARVGSGRERESTGVCEGEGSREREREPLTLVEKHTDLLHFIAQKERKCLELRDQLTIHEKELAELKRKWERIVNRGFASTNDAHAHAQPNPAPNSNPLLNSSLGGVTLDGLKEGVRMIASGINEVIQDLEPMEKEKKSDPTTTTTITTANPKPAHAQRESDSSTSVSLSTGTGSISHFSTSSRSSIWEGPSPSVDHVAGGKGEKEMVATAPSLSRAGSLNSRMHKRASASRPRSKERPAPPSAFVSPRSTSVEFGEFVSSPAVSVSIPASSSSGPSMASANTPTTLPDSSNSSSWMDNMGKKLEELQKGQVFSKSQKRASVLLAGVSHSITSALLPGPTATTPAPSSLSSPRVSSARTTPSKGMENWLDEEEEQTKHAGEVMKPVRVSSTGTKTKTKACKPNAVSSFDDDDWNW